MDLTEIQLREIWQQRVRPAELDESFVPTSAEPTLVIVGGQPGAGKSRSVARALKQFTGITPVMGDDFRKYHPAYDQVMSERP